MATEPDDFEAIRQLKYRYFRLVDTAGWAELGDCFTADATVCYVGGSYRIERNGREAILDYLAGAIHSQCIAVHQGGHPEIRLTSASTATGTWYQNDWFLDLRSNTKLSGACLYDDRYVKEDGAWKIAHSGYQRLYEIVEQLAAPPLLTAHWLGSHAHPPRD
jgi:hypothetical protein